MDSIDWCVGGMAHVIIIKVSVARLQKGDRRDAVWREGCELAKVAIKLNPSMIRTSILGSDLFAQRCNGGLYRFMQREPFRQSADLQRVFDIFAQPSKKHLPANLAELLGDNDQKANPRTADEFRARHVEHHELSISQ